MEICLAHSGLAEKVDQIEKNTAIHREAIDSIRKYVIATLTSTCLTLIGVAITLILRVV